MKIYTKTGDKGQSSLSDGSRISKSSARIRAYGDVDELNSWLGVAASYEQSKKVAELITRVQRELFILGADLATPISEKPTRQIPRIEQRHIDSLESEIDELSVELEKLMSFILPGGVASASYLHLARAVCRRAERSCVHLADEDEINNLALIYLNRLSDWLFTLARYENHKANHPEIKWSGREEIKNTKK